LAALPLLKPDGRQSETALAIQRGVARLLRAHNFVLLTEFTLASGRRADVIALGDDGTIWIIEIKSSAADYHADDKWPEYRAFCDRFSFAIPADMDQALIPAEAELIVADAFGAEVLRETARHPLHAARRKTLTGQFARVAASRLQEAWEAGLSVL
jgi:hypothetical protein